MIIYLNIYSLEIGMLGKEVLLTDSLMMTFQIFPHLWELTLNLKQLKLIQKSAHYKYGIQIEGKK